MTTTAAPAWYTAAEKDLGLREIVGSRHEPRVVEFFAEAGHPYVKDDETAWCAAFANAKLKEGGVLGTQMLNARSFLNWGQPLAKPAIGAILVFKRGSSSWQGHVAFYAGETASSYVCLGGNQSNAVSKANYSKASLLGIRWPAGFALPLSGPAKPAPAPGRLLQIGATGADVEHLQGSLNRLGAKPTLVVDGKFGPATRLAVIAFQKSRGIGVDGAVGPETWATLDVALAHLG